MTKCRNCGCGYDHPEDSFNPNCYCDCHKPMVTYYTTCVVPPDNASTYTGTMYVSTPCIPTQGRTPEWIAQ